jgi:seryl-tRNA synthetase
MLDIKFIRENPDLIREAVRKKHLTFNVDELLAAETKRVELLNAVEAMRAEQNTFTDKIARATDQAERAVMIDQMKAFKETMPAKEEELKAAMETWRLLMLQVPNVPDISVPEGELRTHPYAAQRREDLQRYLSETLTLPAADRITQLREVQRLYPVGSVSWKNLQRQIDDLEGQR